MRSKSQILSKLRADGHITDEEYKVLEQEQKYCDRNICVSNEYNGIGCNECEVTKSQEPKTGWIPVSERLPELNKPLLVTAYHRVYYGHLISESGNYGYPVFRIHGFGDKNHDWVQETMSHEPYSLGRIDAWMYIDIPEPHKVEPQESEDKE